ncbi:MAG TPA: signal peptidase II [Novosphingobium sp.]|nr:signal peptidase II [Novosphingobium sp.]HZV10144.1 signal peptidase II [Novosphingobium sp.]
MKGARARLLGLAVAGLVFLADQAVKAAVTGPLALPEIGQIRLLPIFNLTWTQNFGVSLGLLTASSDQQRWLLVGITAAIALFVCAWLWREKRGLDAGALGLILGGALGNIRDRITAGFVIDYADLHFGDFRPFLVFNLADAAISLGVLIILARSFLSREKRGAETAHSATEM